MKKIIFDLPDGSDFKQNTKSPHILITKDKIENILLKHANRLNARTAWVAPFGISSSLGLALVTTSEFKNFIGISAHTWNAFFILALVASGAWLIISLVILIYGWKKYSINAVIEEFEDESEN